MMRWTMSLAPMRRSLFALALFGMVGAASAQTTDAPATAPSPAAPATPASPTATPAPSTPPASSAPTAAAPSTTAPAPDAAAKPTTPDPTTGASPGDSSISQAMDVAPRPAVLISGSATWDDGFKTLKDAFAKLNDAIAKNGLGAAGHPLAVFTATDDAGFKYSAMVPIAKAPEGKTELSADIKFGATPGGKAIRFQHRASYEDIDSTYEAITAYLDEKGLESKNMFAEEYLTELKTPDDPSLEVDIYVFIN